MNKIASVHIEDFWGDKKVDLEFKDDVNFLIGVNGSGKTTIINLIAAALNADFPTLDRFQFRKLHIKLRDPNKPKGGQVFVEVEKTDKKTSPFPNIIFKVKSKADQEPKKYLLDELEEENLFRYPNDYVLHKLRRRQGKVETDVNVALKELINISWLSIHRSTSPYRRQEERSFESTVDQKIDELSNNMLKYFSLLNRQSSAETEKFQQSIFLSLLTDESEREVFSFASSLNAAEEKESLRQIFNLFRLPESRFSNKLDNHFNSFSNALEVIKKQESMTLNDFAFLIGTRRIHSVVQEWKQLIEKQKSIYQSRDTFLNVLNNLLQRKELFINEKNELMVKTQSGKILSLVHLSSGEKQLIIILGESLLQQATPYIYIADEPELSLHVDWQEKLVPSLKSINPNSQIIFATHSPDIVSHFNDSVIQIEDAIKS